MRTNLTKLAVLTALVFVPATALGAATKDVYRGNANGDPAAKVALTVVKEDGKRKITKVVVKGFPYDAGDFCGSSGRTPKAILKQSFRIKPDRSFKVVGGATATPDPVKGGEVKIVGTATRRKITGTMRYTFGKTGCRTAKLPFRALD